MLARTSMAPINNSVGRVSRIFGIRQVDGSEPAHAYVVSGTQRRRSVTGSAPMTILANVVRRIVGCGGVTLAEPREPEVVAHDRHV
jgi:hypothetical protein